MCEKILKFDKMSNEELLIFREKSKNIFMNKYTDDYHYKNIINIYSKLTDKVVKK